MLQAFIEAKCIAVAGVSRNGQGFGNYAVKALRERGYDVLPVNAQVDTVGAEPCWRSLAALPRRPDVVVTVVPPAEALRVVEEAARLGLTKVWLQQGSASPDAVALAKERGVELVSDACVLMHLKPTGFHAVHGWLARAFGSGVTTTTTSGSSGRG